MGRFFTSTQIYNPKLLDRDRFKVYFCEKMKKEGYELCEADCAELSYVLAFTDNCKWVTLSSETYEQGNRISQADTARIAKMLGTYCVNTIVIDSDCAMLDLYDDKEKKADTAIMGRADDYLGDDIPTPTKAVWEQFLSADSTWEQFMSVVQGDYVFVEDGLSELAPVIEMDSENILFEYEDADENDENFCYLSFRKADPKKEKKLTLKSAFVKVFGEGLEPLGFVRLKKTKLPFYVRLIDGEILQIITYRKKSIKKSGYEQFEVLGGIVSLYRREINFEQPPESWLYTNGRYYSSKCAVPVDIMLKKSVIQFHCDIWGTSMQLYSEPEAMEEKFQMNISNFLCKKDDNEEMLKGVKNAFTVTSKIMLSIFEKVTDCNSCIDYFYNMDTTMSLCEDFEQLNTKPNYYDSDGLMLIKANYRGDIFHYRERKLALEVDQIEKGCRGLYGAKDIEEYKERFRHYTAQQIIIRDKLLDDIELNARAHAEL